LKAEKKKKYIIQHPVQLSIQFSQNAASSLLHLHLHLPLGGLWGAKLHEIHGNQKRSSKSNNQKVVQKSNVQRQKKRIQSYPGMNFMVAALMAWRRKEE